MTAESAIEKQLSNEIATMKRELEDIPMRKEYTAYVKLERKILATQTKLNNLRSGNQTQKLILQYGIPYGCQFLLSFVLIVISIMYRYTPIIVFDGYNYNFTPFGCLMRFPTGVDGAVSVPFWIFMNSYVSRHVASYT